MLGLIEIVVRRILEEDQDGNPKTNPAHPKRKREVRLGDRDESFERRQEKDFEEEK